MPNTTNYNLNIYNASDTTTTFYEFRLGIAGTADTSNFVVIDGLLKQNADAITSLQSKNPAYRVNATFSSGTLYTATVSDFPVSYKTGMLIALQLSATSTSAVTININAIGASYIKKYSSSGALVDISSGDMVKNRLYLCMYDGTEWLIIGLTTGDQMYINGISGNFTSIASDGTLQDSGKTSSDFALSTTTVNGHALSSIS